MSRRIEERSQNSIPQPNLGMDHGTGCLLPKLPKLRSGHLRKPGDVFTPSERVQFDKDIADYEDRRRIAESRQVNHSLGW